jgi:hypothetical protein
MRPFLNRAAAIGIVTLAATEVLPQVNRTANPSIEGVWLGTSTIVTGPGGQSIPKRQPNIFIYTRKYYSQLAVAGDAPRPVLPPAKDPNALTNAEKLARYEHWLPLGPVSAGTYEVKGGKLFQYGVIGRDQSAEAVARNAGKPAPAPVGQDVKVEGNTLIVTGTSADGKTITRRTYTRLEAAAGGGPKSPIEGVWRGTSTVVTGANASANRNRQPNIFIYTKGYYSMLTQDGGAPARPRTVLDPPKDPARLTDAEKLARYEHWAPVGATSGRYEVKGTTYYQYPLVAKNQAADVITRNQTGKLGTVAANSELVFPDGKTMIQVAKSAPGQPVSESRRTYTRLE